MFNPPSLRELRTPSDYNLALGVAAIHISDDGVCAGCFGFKLDDSEPGESLLMPASTVRAVHPAILALRRPSGDIVVGTDCLSTRPSDPKIWGLCRLIGRTYREAINRSDTRHLMLRPSDDGGLLVGLGGYFKPVEYWLMLIVHRVWNDLIAYLGAAPPKVVLTFPDGFDLMSRDRLINAIQSNGVMVDRILRHSVSAALGLAWSISPTRGFPPPAELLGLCHSEDCHHLAEVDVRLAIAYMGYEQTEVTLGEFTGGDHSTVEVIAVRSDDQCGIRDVDDAVVAKMISLISAHLRQPFEPDQLEYGDLLRTAAQVRFLLMNQNQTTIRCPQYRGFTYSIEREDWANWISPVTLRLRTLCSDLSSWAEAGGHAIDGAVCLGALRRVPVLDGVCASSFGASIYRGRALAQDHDAMLLDGAVATAGILTGYLRSLLLLDEIPMELGLSVGSDDENVPFDSIRTLIQRNLSMSGGVKMWVRPRKDRSHRTVLEVVERRRNGSFQTLGMIEWAAIESDPEPDYVIECELKLGYRGDARFITRDLQTGATRQITLPDAARYVVDSETRPVPCTQEEAEKSKKRPKRTRPQDFRAFLEPTQTTQYRISTKLTEPPLSKEELNALLAHIKDETA